MKGKRGSVVAIEPSTGEILAIVSSPFYNADDLTGSRRGVVYDSLRTHLTSRFTIDCQRNL